ncbi:MAG: fibrobacter succinogenes major paralogous domain-containing protein [Prolixibacteraceae bacterium]|nr:fibrobacter succinogenes major paralogous domain-containing protein [Prolixibacteraceae bacterium]
MKLQILNQVGRKQNKINLLKKIIQRTILMSVFAITIVACTKDESNIDDPENNGASGKMTDLDGNVYKTVTIGTQIWMGENLCTTKYNDGTLIANVTDNKEWTSLSTGAYCNYNNTENSGTNTYGRLYNWYAINTGKLAPKGWHIPTDKEWTTLTSYLGGEGIAGIKMKESGTTNWISPNSGATNSSSFTGLPGGSRFYTALFYNFSYYGYWWSASEHDTSNAWLRSLCYNYNDVTRSYYDKRYGFSVRCIKD